MKLTFAVYLLIAFLIFGVLLFDRVRVGSDSEESYMISPRMNVQSKETGKGTRYQFTEGSAPVSYSRAMDLLQTSEDFRDLIKALIAPSARAVFWEVAPVKRDSYHTQLFEFIINPAKSLDTVTEDKGTFSDYFEQSSDSHVAVFPNLGRDAVLIAPCPSPTVNSAHFASFLNTASAEQIHELFKTIGSEVAKRISTQDRTVWVSTSGLGVYWLHVRLDSYPKYYTHSAYKNGAYKTLKF